MHNLYKMKSETFRKQISLRLTIN